MTHHSWTWEHYTTAEGRLARGVVEVILFFDAVGDPTIFVDAFGEMLDSPEKARFLEWDTLDKEEEIEAAIQTALKKRDEGWKLVRQKTAHVPKLVRERIQKERQYLIDCGFVETEDGSWRLKDRLKLSSRLS
jgi:hypothetical protein